MKLEDLLDVLPRHGAVAIAATLRSLQQGEGIEDNSVIEDALGSCEAAGGACYDDYQLLFWQQVVEVMGESGGIDAIMRGCAAGAKPGYEYP